MTLPPVIRIFFAIDLPTSTKENLGSFISLLKKKSKSNAIRWTKAENLHITLHFLAEVKTEHLPTIIDNVRKELQGTHLNSILSIGSLHLFPNPYRPRVIVLDLTPQENLATLSCKIGYGIQSANYEVDSRPFRGHLTLGRIKQPHGVSLNFLSEFTDLFATEKITVNEVILFRSEPQQHGSKYTALERLPLL